MPLDPGDADLDPSREACTRGLLSQRRGTSQTELRFCGCFGKGPADPCDKTVASPKSSHRGRRRSSTSRKQIHISACFQEFQVQGTREYRRGSLLAHCLSCFLSIGRSRSRLRSHRHQSVCSPVLDYHIALIKEWLRDVGQII